MTRFKTTLVYTTVALCLLLTVTFVLTSRATKRSELASESVLAAWQLADELNDAQALTGTEQSAVLDRANRLAEKLQRISSRHEIASLRGLIASAKSDKTLLSKAVTTANDLDFEIQQDAKTQARTTARIQIATGFSCLLLIAIAFVFFIYPNFKMLNDGAELLDTQFDELECQTDELHRQREDIEALNKFIENNHETYAAAARRLEQLFKQLPVACLSYDRFLNVQEWNEACANLFGLKAYESDGLSMREALKYAPDYEDAMYHLFDTPLRFEDRAVATWRLERGENTIWLQTITFPILGTTGSATGGVAVFVDVTEQCQFETLAQESMIRMSEQQQELELRSMELQALNEQLEMLASRDGLTGLFNHRAFQDRLGQAFQDASHGSQSLALILLDVDHFKKLNDTMGHPAGDQVLKTIAKVLENETPMGCIAARYGGEEFAIVFTGLSQADVCKFAEHFRSCIEASCPLDTTVTASFGLAFYEEGLYGPPELIARADKALYHSKHSGRNRVTVAHELWTQEDEEAA